MEKRELYLQSRHVIDILQEFPASPLPLKQVSHTVLLIEQRGQVVGGCAVSGQFEAIAATSLFHLLFLSPFQFIHFYHCG